MEPKYRPGRIRLPVTGGARALDLISESESDRVRLAPAGEAPGQIPRVLLMGPKKRIMPKWQRELSLWALKHGI
jgi:hypothetical protein